MIKTLFTRKTLITIALGCIYSLLLVYVCVCIDGAHSVITAKNLINKIAIGMRFEQIKGQMASFVCVMLVAVFITVAVTGVCFESRFAVFKKINPRSVKMVGLYAITVVGSIALGLGIGILFQNPLTEENVGNLLKYLGQCLLLTTVIYVVAFVAIGALLMLIVNFIFVDKPFRFFSKQEEPAFEDEDTNSYDVEGSFDVVAATNSTNATGGTAVAAGGDGCGNGKTVVENEELKDREVVFPTLSAIDVKYEGFDSPKGKSDQITLDKLCVRFREYLASAQKLYFDIDTIRFFISGMGASHFEILEGLSGTGKSSLPRYFAKFVGANVLFMPVQATWRDKSNILGYFNEFSKTYTETEFLARIYEANYNPDAINLYVLDEMNISRVEYYFADLLSVLEYPVDEWKLKIMNFPHDFVPPVKLEDGFLRIPENSWFVGTANRDDSTFTITDKVYDRAITLEFSSHNQPFSVKEDVQPVHITYSAFAKLFSDAIADKSAQMTKADYDKLDKISSFIQDRFDVAIGNRILHQLQTIVPVFVAAGGAKDDVIDFMLCKKLFAKLEGKFEEYVKPALEELLGLMAAVYGSGALKRSEKLIQRIIRTL